MGYTKLDAGITDSTIWQAPDATRIVWITMLAMADQNGYIGASVPGLAGRARVSMDACIEALEAFTGPDKWSRTKDHEGRRIAEAVGGWVLLNHGQYREKQNADDRRERSRVAMAALRDKRKQAETVNAGYPKLTKLTQAEADTEAEAKIEIPTAAPSPPTTEKSEPIPRFAPGFEAFWKAYPRKIGKDAAARVYAKRKFGVDQQSLILAAIEKQRRSEQWTRDGGQYIPNPATWIGQGRWDDEPEPAGTYRRDSAETPWQRSQRESVHILTGGLVSAKSPDQQRTFDTIEERTNAPARIVG